MKSLTRLRALLGGLLAALCAGTAAWAAPYPEHPVRLVVPYPAGGATDGAIRVLAERLGAAWGQPVIVDNRAGASGRLGLALVAKSPHSYNFVAATNSTISDELTRGGDGSFLLARDLVPVVTIFTTPVALLVHTGTGVDSMAQYIALAQRRPGAVSFGSSGEGTSTHFYGELLKRESRIDITHIPFAGEGPNLTELLGGHIQSAFLSASGAKKAQQTGRTRILAITTPGGSMLLPGVPSFTQLGIAGLDRDSWVGLFAPLGTPQAVRDEVAREVRKAFAVPEVRERYVQLGLIAEGGTPQELEQRVQADRAYWTRVVQETGIKLK